MDKDVCNTRTHCIRCGECCIGSSPTLQMEDLHLVRDGFFENCDLYTVRVGEFVHDTINEKLITADKEIIKIKEKKEGKGCIYYDEEAKACMIYDHRPVQCAALACWDTSEFMKVYARPKLDRKEIIQDRTLLGLMEEHDRKCSYSELDRCARRIEKEGEKAVLRILELLKFDYQLRPFISKKVDINSNEMDFLFGRPLIQTITMFGLQVLREPDGSFFLTVLGSEQTPRAGHHTCLGAIKKED